MRYTNRLLPYYYYYYYYLQLSQHAFSPRVVDRQCASGLSTFHLVTTGDIRRLISRAPCKHCDLDLVPTWLVKCAIDVLAPVIAAVCNASLQSGFSVTKASPGDRAPQETFNGFELFSSHFKSYIPVQDHGTCGNQTVYQPRCSERSLPGKAIRVWPISFWVGSASAPQLHRFCYWPRRSHWSSTFLDLSSAFDTVDHASQSLLSIFESRFSVRGQSLAWFRSYLTDRAQVFTIYPV